MLTRLAAAEYDRYADWAYALALDLTRSGYPTYADGIKTREEFRQRALDGMTRPCEEILLAWADGEVCGWIHWYWQSEDRYAAACSFLTASHTEEALAEFAAYAAEKCPGYALHMGFPEDNVNAVRWLAGHGFRLLEKSVNHTLFFDRYARQDMPSCVRRMATGDEAVFRALHTDTDLYWTAERILNHIQDWHVYLYGTDGGTMAALFAQGLEDGWPEIYGIVGDVTPEAYRGLLTACLHECKAAGSAHMTYFEEDERMLPILAELGFEVVSRYRCYQKLL